MCEMFQLSSREAASGVRSAVFTREVWNYEPGVWEGKRGSSQTGRRDGWPKEEGTISSRGEKCFPKECQQTSEFSLNKWQ